MKYKTTALRIKDIPQILTLLNTSLQADFPDYIPRISTVYGKHIFNENFFRRFLKNKDNAIFGVFDDKNLIGFINLWHHYGGVAEVNWLIVDKNYREQGIGTMLLDFAEKWALKTYKHHLYLHTEGAKNIEFYKKRGYEYVGAQRNVWFGATEHLMQKILREKPFEEVFEKYLKKK